MMNKIREKLKSRSGESLVELLVSILIVVILVAALCSATVISNTINKKVFDINKGFSYTDVTDMGEYTVSVEITDEGIEGEKIYTRTTEDVVTGTPRVDVYKTMDKYYYIGINR